MNRIVIVWGLVAFLLTGAPVKWTFAADDVETPGITAPNGLSNSAIETARGLAEVTASQANSKATVRYGFDRALRYTGSVADLHPLTWNGSITASAPLGSGSDPSQLATLDNLADAAQVQLKSQWVFSSYLVPENASDLQNMIRSAIEDRNRDLKDTKDKKLLATKVADLKNHGCRVENDQIVQSMSTSTAYCVLPAKEADDYQRLFFPRAQWLFIPGFGGTVGQKSYKYLNATSDSNVTANRTPWSAQAYVGIHFGNSLTTIGYRFDRSFKDANQGSLCPTPTFTLTTCKTGPLGIPTETDQSVPYIEYRRRISSGFAIAPIVNYDLRKSVLGVSIPVYFISDGKGSLTGGMALGWRSDKGGLQLSVIVNTAFSAYTIT